MAKRRRRKHSPVIRAERIEAPPEAAQHQRPWPLQLLLQAGPEGDGLDSDEFEAAVEIVETFKALTIALQVRGTAPEHIGVAHGELSDRAALMISIWFEWRARLGDLDCVALAQEIEDDRAIVSVALLRSACRSWLKAKEDITRPRRSLDRTYQMELPARACSDVRLPHSPMVVAHAAATSHPSPAIRQGPSRAGAPAQGVVRSAPAKR